MDIQNVADTYRIRRGRFVDRKLHSVDVRQDFGGLVTDRLTGIGTSLSTSERTSVDLHPLNLR